MKKSTKIILIVAGALVVTYLLPSPASSSNDEPLTPDAPPSLTLGACENRDGDDCYWESDAPGNSGDTDFIRVNGVTYYPAPQPADFDQ